MLVALLPKQVHLAQDTASRNAETQRSAAAKRGDGRTRLKSASPKARGSGYS